MRMIRMFPDERTAAKWFERVLWGAKGRCCGKCGGLDTIEAKHKTMPYWCRDCRSYFSVRTGTSLAHSNVPLQKWAIAIYLCLTSLKSISSMKLHRDIEVTQSTAWFMLHRIREAWAAESGGPFDGPVEVDEAYFGGRVPNMSNSRRREIRKTGTGYEKSAVVGIKDRASNRVSAKTVETTRAEELNPFIDGHTKPGAEIYADEARVYSGLPKDKHATVQHSTGEYVRGQVHIQGIESFWAMLKRAHKGTFHKLSPKHLNRYVQEFAAKHNMRGSDTLAQMQDTVARLVGRRLLYRSLIAHNGLPSGARS